LGVAEAAADVDVPYTLSTAAASSIEEVAQASGQVLSNYGVSLYGPDCATNIGTGYASFSCACHFILPCYHSSDILIYTMDNFQVLASERA
jgi:hypothetical protein